MYIFTCLPSLSACLSVCLSVYLSLPLYVCPSLSLPLSLFIYLCLSLSLSLSFSSCLSALPKSICLCLPGCMCVCGYVCMHACMYVCTYVCMYVCMHGCLYICLHIQRCKCIFGFAIISSLFLKYSYNMVTPFKFMLHKHIFSCPVWLAFRICQGAIVEWSPLSDTESILPKNQCSSVGFSQVERNRRLQS
jgi:hypothetical protein